MIYIICIIYHTCHTLYAIQWPHYHMLYMSHTICCICHAPCCLCHTLLWAPGLPQKTLQSLFTEGHAYSMLRNNRGRIDGFQLNTINTSYVSIYVLSMLCQQYQYSKDISIAPAFKELTIWWELYSYTRNDHAEQTAPQEGHQVLQGSKQEKLFLALGRGSEEG